MKYLLPVLLLVLPFTLVNAADLPLLPYPHSVIQQPGQFLAGNQWNLVIKGKQTAELKTALERFRQRVTLQTGKSIRFVKGREKNAHLFIHIQSSEVIGNSLSSMNESYRLQVRPGRIELHAEQLVGVVRGLETLLQLVGLQQDALALPLVDIQDKPRFIWRGLLLDSSRHFFSVASIKRQLDIMAAAKFNLFHWHLTDDQGWRLESKKFPRLQQFASDGQYYTREQVRDIVAYARDRGIHVLPEIDIPGHASAIAVAYPELMSAPGPYAMEYRWGVHKPTLNPANERVYEFVDQLIAEVVELFPFDYVHIGGDEVDPQHWQENADIQAFMQANGLVDHLALQAYFNQRVQKILSQHKRNMIGWDEIQHPDLPNNIVIHSWQGPDGVSNAIRHGFNAILSTGYYLDQPQTAAYHYRQDPLPQPPFRIDAPAAGESWQSWSFTLPRQRGKPVSGSFTLLDDGKQTRGFIDFAGKSRREVKVHRYTKNRAQFSLDTWMGPVEFDVNMDQRLGGKAWVGNVAYPVSGKQIAGSNHAQTGLPEPQVAPYVLRAEDYARVLGGEVALWSELVDEGTLDLRLWPRALAVAERLWSAQDRRDEVDLYQRLETTMTWARMSVGVQDQQQREIALRRLAAGAGIEPLAIFSEALEPAHYYHRQHQKSVSETYSKADHLNQLVDALPAENNFKQNQLAIFENELSVLDENDKKYLRKSLKTAFEKWNKNHQPLLDLVQKRKDLQGLLPLAERLNVLSELAMELLRNCEASTTLSPAQIVKAQAAVDQAKTMDQEMVIGAAWVVEKMLQSDAYCP